MGHRVSRTTEGDGRNIALARKTGTRRWKLWRDGVNHVFLDTFLRCRESCRLMFVEGWSSRLQPQAYELQDALRWALWKARVKGLTDADKLGRQYQRLWLKHVLTPSSTQMTNQEVVFCLLPVMLRAAFRRWGQDSRRDWTTISPTRTVEWRYRDGKQARLRARVAAFRDNEHGGIWLMETYVGQFLKADHFEDAAFFNLRTIMGLYVLREVIGEPPAGVIYNVVKRPVHKWPTTRNYHYYLKNSASALEHPDKYLQRVRASISPTKLEQCFERLLAPLMDDVRLWARGRNHYPNVWNQPDAGMYKAVVHGDFSDCYRRQSVFCPIHG